MSEPTFLEVVDEIFAAWSMDQIDDETFRKKIIDELNWTITYAKCEPREGARPAEDPRWSYADQRAAYAEGWEIFETNRDDDETAKDIVDGKPYGYRPFELQRDDDAAIFRSDTDAWRHVRERAAAGSVLHQKALAFLKEESPAEHEAIMGEL